jgi:uncharacterized protein affecting Mg2+/Co2+ transport
MNESGRGVVSEEHAISGKQSYDRIGRCVVEKSVVEVDSGFGDENAITERGKVYRARAPPFRVGTHIGAVEPECTGDGRESSYDVVESTLHH